MNKNRKIMFNLQKFAAADTNVTSGAEMSKDMKDNYDMELLRRSLPNLVYAQF